MSGDGDRLVPSRLKSMDADVASKECIRKLFSFEFSNSEKKNNHYSAFYSETLADYAPAWVPKYEEFN